MKTLGRQTAKSGTGTGAYANVPLFGTDAAGTAESKKYAVSSIWLCNTSLGGADLTFRFGTDGVAYVVPSNAQGTARLEVATPPGHKRMLSLSANIHLQVIGNTVTYSVFADLVD